MGAKQNTARDRWRWRMKRGHEDTQNVKAGKKYDFKNSLKYIERRGVFHLSNNQSSQLPISNVISCSCLQPTD